MVGLINDVSKTVSSFFKRQGDVIALIGDIKTAKPTQSEYLRIIHGIDNAPCPEVNLEKAGALIDSLCELSGKSLLSSAHDCSEGGLLVALAESSMNTNGNMIGVKVDYSLSEREDIELLSEETLRVIVSFKPENEDKILDILKEKRLKYKKLGITGGGELNVNNYVKLPLSEISERRSLFFKKIGS
jgi:phosphoribosylformylglycinamidine synthase